MSMKIKISADSTCDLPKEIAEKYNIGISPLYVVRDGVSCKDGVEITPDEIFRHFEKTGQLCTTAAVSYGDYLDTFGEYLKEYDAVIHFTISASMSSCWQNASLVAAELGNIHVVDTENLSLGIGILAIAAAEMAHHDKSVQEILDFVNCAKKHLDISFVVDTLEYLHKGGRCSALAAMGANILKLHPCIEVVDGAMGVGKKYRGSIDKCVPAYIADRLSAAEFDSHIAWIVDSGVPDSVREAAIEQVKASGKFEKVMSSRAGCTISSHCGTNTLGIMFLRK